MASLYEGGCKWCGFPILEACKHIQCHDARANGYCTPSCAKAAIEVLLERLKKAVA